ncbi:MAG: NAD-dependent epimerase/dehydratase family protein [Candidatus Latescibacterota bacterium]|nr:NAD-dependent epimerase/dehydratase family protein [Candidatus Latescibacterota bacterium]
MRVVVIGGKGKVGTYLVPMLVERGHEVINVSRGTQQPYLPNSCWKDVRQVTLDRQQEDAEGIFGKNIADLKPDVVIDMICFKVENEKHLAESLKGELQHFLSCGSVWIHELCTEIPVVEQQSRNATDDYGINKAAIEDYLTECTEKGWFAGTVAHPGHIVGPGHEPINPAGHKDPSIFSKLMHGEEVILPHFGRETVHHVHAEDVAQVFIRAIENREKSAGQGFHAVSSTAVNLEGFARAVAAWFGKEANLRFVPWDEWSAQNNETDVALTQTHLLHSPNASIEKAKRLLGYEPRYTSLEAVRESVDWLIEHGRIK